MSKKKESKTKEIFIFVALIIFMVPGICAMISAAQNIVGRFDNPANESPEVVFSEEYPFSDADTAGTAAEDGITLKKPVSASGKYLTAVNKFTGYVDNFSGKNNVVSPLFFRIYGKTEKALGKNLIDDEEESVIRLKNGYLAYAYQYSGEYKEPKGIIDFDKWLKEKNIPFLYVIPIDKSNDRYAAFPKGFSSGYAEAEKEYIKILDANDISYLNSEEILISENEDFYSWFYKTDHHWNVRAGFSVASAIAERLKTESGLPTDIDALDRTNFRVVPYDSLFLGSQGKKTTAGYISPEKFEIYYPLSDTSFSIEIPTMAIDRIGDFDNTMINRDALKAGDYYNKNAYTAFLYSDVPLVRIHNLNCKNGVRALMVKTSNANVVDTYLPFAVEYLDIIDLRCFDGSIRTFIEKTHPDAVLSCAYPSEIPDNIIRNTK